MTELNLPLLTTNDDIVNRAFRIALGDLSGNIALFKDGLLSRPQPCILAGLDYNTPWTRDTAINTWNGAGLLFPQAALNTQLSVLEQVKDKVRISGQYWDAIIWTTGAWHHYLYTGDRKFLAIALKATSNSLTHFEETEFNPRLNLFRGPACYGDGVSAYPDVYAQTGNSSDILDWPQHNPDKKAGTGFGIPMHALSTNALYFNAYRLATLMAVELGVKPSAGWESKASRLKVSINRHFWNPKKDCYRYIVDTFGGCDHNEGLGHSFALMFGISNARQTAAVLKNQHITPQGIPCVWPSYSRYTNGKGDHFGRHSGTVWPHVQGFWAVAAAENKRPNLFEHEIFSLAGLAGRDNQFNEIYHPKTGAIYGGMQESQQGMRLWNSCARQTWSATAYLRMVLMGLCGMRFEPKGIRFAPTLPERIGQVRLESLAYRKMSLNVEIEGTGTRVKEFKVNNRPVSSGFLNADGRGEKTVSVKLHSR